MAMRVCVGTAKAAEEFYGILRKCAASTLEWAVCARACNNRLTGCLMCVPTAEQCGRE